MNKKTLLILSVAVIALGALCILILNREDTSWKGSGSSAEKGGELLKKLNVNDISEITVQNPDKSVTIHKKDGKWTVENAGEYPADFEKVSSFTLKLKDLKNVQNVHAGPSQYGRLKLLNPAENADKKQKKEKCGTLIVLKDNKGKTLSSLIIGKEYNVDKQKIGGTDDSPYNFSASGGKYLLVEGMKNPVVVSESLYEAVPDSSAWLNKDFVKVANIKSVSYSDGDEKNSWTISRDKKSSKFKVEGLKKDEEQNGSNISTISSAFGYMTFNGIAEYKNAAELMKLKKHAVMTVRTFDGFTYTFTIAEKDGKGFLNVVTTAKLAEKRIPAKDEKKEDKEKLDKKFSENLKKLKDKLKREEFFNNWVYTFPKYKIDQLMKTRKDIVSKKKKEDKKKSAEKTTDVEDI
jgi:hypothetical protein